MVDKQFHHPLLHQATVTPIIDTATTEQAQPEIVAHAQVEHFTGCTTVVLLQVLPVRLYRTIGKTIDTYALLDKALTVTHVESELAE